MASLTFRYLLLNLNLELSLLSLDAESTVTFVHAFVASRVDYCDALLAYAPKATTDKLQPGIERVQALADISRSELCCHSNEIRATIANPPNSA